MATRKGKRRGPYHVWTKPGDLVAREGMYAYLHMIMAKSDPERSPRKSDGLGAERAVKRRQISKLAWEIQLLAFFTVNGPATFNRACIALADVNACDASQAMDDALWALVAEGKLVHTYGVPVLFKIVKGKHDRPKETRRQRT